MLNPNQSYKTVSSTVKVTGNKIMLPKHDWVMFANSRLFYGNIVSATVRRNPSGKYFVSMLVDEHIDKLPKTNSTVGIDMGIAKFAYFSDGSEPIENTRWFRSMQDKLVREQRKLSRKLEVAKKSIRKPEDCKNYQK